MGSPEDSLNLFALLRGALNGSVAAGDASFGPPRHAAVCAVIAGPPSAPSMCFIRRAKWAGDPWSEHIALPGGSRNGDERPEETVRREVAEEIGLALSGDAELLQLPQLRIRLAGRERLLLLDPFVHYLGDALPELRCGPEVESAFWTPVAELWNALNLDYLALADPPETLIYPALRIPEGMIFGITLRVLTLLTDQVGLPLRHLEEIPLLRRAPKP